MTKRRASELDEEHKWNFYKEYYDRTNEGGLAGGVVIAVVFLAVLLLAYFFGN